MRCSGLVSVLRLPSVLLHCVVGQEEGHPAYITCSTDQQRLFSCEDQTQTRKFDHGLTQLLHADLHWLDVPECIKYKLCTMMRRCQDGTAPQYLAVHWSSVSETASREHLRSAASHQLTVPPHRQTTYGGWAFAVAGPSTWNSLPKTSTWSLF